MLILSDAACLGDSATLHSLSMVSTSSPHLLTQLSPEASPGVGHKTEAPVRHLRRPWNKYSLARLGRGNQQHETARGQVDPRRRNALVKWHIRRPSPKTGGNIG